MCDFINGFILCSCDEENKKAELEFDKNEYVWELKTLKKKIPARGITDFPDSDIGKGLKSEWVLLNLMSRNCFDFDYQPSNGDNLIIYNRQSRKSPFGKPVYLSFIYRNSEWTEDFYNEISELTKLKNKGKVKATHSNV